MASRRRGPRPHQPTGIHIQKIRIIRLRRQPRHRQGEHQLHLEQIPIRNVIEHMFRLQTTTDKTGPITEVPPKILERILAPRTSTSTSTEEAPVAPEKMVTCVCGAAWWGKEADLIPLVQQ